MIGSIIIWVILGALAGWIASMIMKTNEQQGGVMNIVVGIVGALVGGFLYTALTGDNTDSFIGQLLVAIVGAVLVLAVWKGFSGKSHA